MDRLVGAFYEASGNEGRGNDRGAVEQEEVGRRYTHYRDFESIKALARYNCQQDFKKSCKVITSYFQFNQTQAEQFGVSEYIQYSIVVSEAIKKENDMITKQNKQNE